MSHSCARRPGALALASIVTLGLVATLSPPSVRACGMPPTLGERLDGADLIVTGTVGERSEVEVADGDDSYTVQVAEIHVGEVLKGIAERGQSIRVANVDEDAFLRGGSDGDSVPLAMRTGLFVISADGFSDEAPWNALQVYDVTDEDSGSGLTALIRRYAEIGRIEDPVRQRTAFLEWIVQCSESTGLRRDGFYEFSRASGEHEWRTQSEDPADREAVEAKVDFTDGQIDRLVTVWLDSLAHRDDGTMWMGDALGAYRGDLVADTLLAAIAGEGEGGDDDVGTWMRTVASIYEWRTGHMLTQRLWESEDSTERAAIVQQFLELAPIRGELAEAIAEEEFGEEATANYDEFEAVAEVEAEEREAVQAAERNESDATNKDEVIQVGSVVLELDGTDEN